MNERLVKSTAMMAQRARLGVPYLVKAAVMLDGEPHETPRHIQDAAKLKAATKRDRKNAKRQLEHWGPAPCPTAFVVEAAQ